MRTHHHEILQSQGSSDLHTSLEKNIDISATIQETTERSFGARGMANHHVDGNTDTHIGLVTAHEQGLLQYTSYSNDQSNPTHASIGQKQPVQFDVVDLWGGSVKASIPSSFNSMA